MPLSLKQNDKGIYQIDGYALGQRVRTSAKTDNHARCSYKRNKEIELAIAARREYKTNTDPVSNASFNMLLGKRMLQNTDSLITSRGRQW